MKRWSQFFLLLLCSLVIWADIDQTRSFRPTPTDRSPQILRLDNIVMMPSSFLRQWIGVDTKIDRNGSVTMRRRDKTLSMTLNSTTAFRNGTPLKLSAPVLPIADVIYVPLDSLAIAFALTMGIDIPRNQISLTNPDNGQVTQFPIRGRLLRASLGRGILTRSSTMAYAAYLFFSDTRNQWRDGRSVSNPNLPLVWVMHGPRTIWSQTTEGNEVVELSAANLTNSGHQALWFTTRFVGADYVQQNFHAVELNRTGVNNLIGTREGYIPYDSTNGGLIGFRSRRPVQFAAISPVFGDVHAQGPVGYTLSTYTWNGKSFILANTQRAQGNDLYNTIRTTFRIPITRGQFQQLSKGMVVFI